MKLELNRSTVETRTLDFVNFRIGNEEIIMSLLTEKLYSYPLKTAIQEYICNALDANNEASNEDKPIEIHVPTYNEPYFSVRDYGPGLNEHRVREIFTVIGESTKRHTNEQIGGFGIGAKSGFAYTDHFWITSWVNGTKTTYLALKDGSKLSLQVLDVQKTDEPNGVEVRFDTDEEDINRAQDYIIRATILVQDKVRLSQQLHYPKLKIEPWKWLIENDSSDELFIAVGPVLYPVKLSQVIPDDIEFDLRVSNYARWIVILPFEVGEIKLAANREQLALTEECKNRILKKLQEYIKCIQDYIKNQALDLTRTIDFSIQPEFAISQYKDYGLLFVNGHYDLVSKYPNIATVIPDDVNRCSYRVSRRVTLHTDTIVTSSPLNYRNYREYALKHNKRIIVLPSGLERWLEQFPFYIPHEQLRTSKEKKRLTQYILVFNRHRKRFTQQRVNLDDYNHMTILYVPLKSRKIHEFWINLSRLILELYENESILIVKVGRSVVDQYKLQSLLDYVKERYYEILYLAYQSAIVDYFTCISDYLENEYRETLDNHRHLIAYSIIAQLQTVDEQAKLDYEWLRQIGKTTRMFTMYIRHQYRDVKEILYCNRAEDVMKLLRPHLGKLLRW